MPSIAPDSLPASPDQWWRHWAGCVEDAAAADVLLSRDLSGENQCGGLIEMGAALASGRQVFLVSENWWSVEHHARVRNCDRNQSYADRRRRAPACGGVVDEEPGLTGHDQRCRSTRDKSFCD